MRISANDEKESMEQNWMRKMCLGMLNGCCWCHVYVFTIRNATSRRLMEKRTGRKCGIKVIHVMLAHISWSLLDKNKLGRCNWAEIVKDGKSDKSHRRKTTKETSNHQLAGQPTKCGHFWRRKHFFSWLSRSLESWDGDDVKSSM